jgi:hypothetical protein
MPRKASTAANGLIQASLVKKCSRAYHRPGSNKGCASGTCQHTCEPAAVAGCAHKWTVRYSAAGRQSEQSFATRGDAETFQLQLSADKQVQGQMFTDPRAANVKFLPLCERHIGQLARAGEASKAAYRSNMRNPAVVKLLAGKTVREAARMDAEVGELVNKTLGHLSDDYRGNVRRIIAGTLDDCVRRGIIARHTLGGVQLGAQLVTAEQWEARNVPAPEITDAMVAMLSAGMRGPVLGATGRYRMRTVEGLGIAPWLQRTMGLRIREALGVRKADFRTRSDGSRYLHLCWQASRDGRTLEPLKHRQAGDFRDIPVPALVWDMARAMPDGPLCPGPATPYLPYGTAVSRFNAVMTHAGVTGAHTHALRHQFATEALETDPRELANISQVLGHESTEVTLRAYIHASASAEQRIGAMMNNRWTAAPAPAAPAPALKAAA